ncbi:MAG: rhodanese-like domain-containing protein [Bacteroidetes bacterium]|nr:rhodanese-like domain-containing protein [Bacteroidota bacterium]
MNSINARELKQRIDSGEDLRLVNAMEENKFRARHIPGSLNLFTKEGIENTLKKNDRIIVYCTDFSCNKSILLYHLLDAMGYEYIFRFAGGLVEWEDAGYPLAGEKAK